MTNSSENDIKNHWNATKRRQNFNRQNKKPDTHKGSLLHAYIKAVTEAEEAAAYKMKKSISNMEMKMLRGCNEHLANLFLEINILNDEGYGHEVKKQHHMINGNGGYKPMLHGIPSGFVNIDYGAMVKRLGLEDEKKGEMDLIEVGTVKF
ncbi:hypothetical protein SESBI_17312 [Sesbania bispinosa]|nr:hypothetical protein SESBI_17312 [Sesbania bispinosa]